MKSIESHKNKKFVISTVLRYNISKNGRGAYMSDTDLTKALSDTGMPQEAIQDFLAAYHDNRKEKAKRILSDHRAKLLSEVHSEQTKLYNFDFLVRQLKEYL